MRNQTLDLWISRFDSLPVSYGELDEFDRKLGRNNVKFLRPFPAVHPLHSEINMQILHTVFYKFPKVLTRRICLTIKRFFSWWSFPLFV